MSFSIKIDWLNPPPEEETFGPETATWAEISIELDGTVITRNHPADYRADDRDAVIGPTSGIADWIVENWIYLLWEVHSPFPKSGLDRIPVPSLRDASRGWPDLADESINRSALALWQHRHTLGHGCSDLALPSVVFLPEDRDVGIVVDHVPASLSPTLRFSPKEGEHWPLDPKWTTKADMIAALSSVVDETLSRARRSDSGKHWAEWLSTRWDHAKTAAKHDSADARRVMFGPLVSAKWEDISSRFSDNTAAIAGVLLDAEVLASDDELTHLELSLSERLGPSTAVSSRSWSSLGATSIDRMLRPFEQGYRLARLARSFIKNDFEPLVDLPAVLNRFSVNLVETDAKIFKSAALVSRSGNASVFLSSAGREAKGVAPARFSICASLGRILAEATVGEPFGAAHSSQSRWLRTQRANAFAAEFLLPAQALDRQPEIEQLCDEYGISRSAARWHLQNRRPATESRLGT